MQQNKIKKGNVFKALKYLKKKKKLGYKRGIVYKKKY